MMTVRPCDGGAATPTDEEVDVIDRVIRQVVGQTVGRIEEDYVQEIWVQRILRQWPRYDRRVCKLTTWAAAQARFGLLDIFRAERGRIRRKPRVLPLSVLEQVLQEVDGAEAVSIGSHPPLHAHRVVPGFLAATKPPWQELWFREVARQVCYNRRERQAFLLMVAHGYNRAQAAAVIGLSPSRVSQFVKRWRQRLRELGLADRSRRNDR